MAIRLDDCVISRKSAAIGPMRIVQVKDGSSVASCLQNGPQVDRVDSPCLQFVEQQVIFGSLAVVSRPVGKKIPIGGGSVGRHRNEEVDAAPGEPIVHTGKQGCRANYLRSSIDQPRTLKYSVVSEIEQSATSTDQNNCVTKTEGSGRVLKRSDHCLSKAKMVLQIGVHFLRKCKPLLPVGRSPRDRREPPPLLQDRRGAVRPDDPDHERRRKQQESGNSEIAAIAAQHARRRPRMIEAARYEATVFRRAMRASGRMLVSRRAMGAGLIKRCPVHGGGFYPQSVRFESVDIIPIRPGAPRARENGTSRDSAGA